MHRITPLSLVFASLLSGIPAAAQEPGFACPIWC